MYLHVREKVDDLTKRLGDIKTNVEQKSVSYPLIAGVSFRFMEYLWCSQATIAYQTP